TYLDLIAEGAEVADFLQQNDFHGAPRSVPVGVRDQREVARVLHGARELALVARLGPGVAARNDAPGLGDEGLEHGQVLVVDLGDALRGESAVFLAPEIT